MRVLSFPSGVRTAIIAGLGIGIFVVALNQVVSPLALLIGYGAASTALVIAFVAWRQQQSSESLLFENDENERRKTQVMARRPDDQPTSNKTMLNHHRLGESHTQVDDTKPAPPLDDEGSAPDSDLATFRILNDAGTGIQDIAMRQPRLRLGRTRDAGVDEVIASPRISQVHCSIEYDHHEHTFYIQDEKTTNGTYVDGRRLRVRQRERLMPGSLIRLGQRFEMRFEPHVWVLEGQSPVSMEMPRRAITTRAEFMEGLPLNTLSYSQRGPITPDDQWPSKDLLPPSMTDQWPPAPMLSPARSSNWPPSDVSIPSPPSPYEGDTQVFPTRPKTTPAKPSSGFTQTDNWMD